jgi:hypothetical protein
VIEGIMLSNINVDVEAKTPKLVRGEGQAIECRGVKVNGQEFSVEGAASPSAAP